MTPEELKAARQRASRPRRTVPIVLDGDLRQRIELVTAERDAAVREGQRNQADRRLANKRTADARVAELDAQLDALYEQAKSSTLLVVLEGMQETPFRAMCREYAAGEGVEPWGLEKVDRVRIEEPLIRACIKGHRTDMDADEIHPIDADTVDWLLKFCTVEQKETLFLGAWGASRGSDAVPLRVMRSPTRTSAGG